MALPKRRHSKTRGRKRRTNDKVVKPQASACPSCGEPKLPHRMCPHCGTYNGREIIVDEKEKTERGKTARKAPLGWKR
jgi:large subunit ribosomal protein L32